MRLLLVTALAGCDYAPSSAAAGDGPPKDTALDTPFDTPSVEPDAPRDAATTIVIEAESPTLSESSNMIHTWTVETGLAGFSSTGYVTAKPDDNTNCLVITDQTCGCFNSYGFTVELAGTYRVVLRHHSPDTSRDSLHWYLDGTPMATEDFPLVVEWTDHVSSQLVTLAPGAHTLGVRMRENDTSLDQIRFELQ